MKLSTRQLRSIKRLSILLAGAYALAPTGAIAKHETQYSGGAGINLGLTFSKGFKPHFTFGIEAFLVQHLTQLENQYDYSSGPSTVIGPLVQLNISAKTGLKGVLALTIGQAGNFGENAVMGELGVAYRFKYNDWGLRVGALYEPNNFNVAIRHDFFINETTFGTGFRTPSTYGEFFEYPGTVVQGRPLRTGENDQNRKNRSVINNLAGKWADMAQDEFEAVFAFGNLAFELMAAGAPQILIEKALTSAEQEVAHTKYCAIQAHNFDEFFKLQKPDDVFRAPLNGVAALSRFAVEGLIDGWQGEGLAASLMQAGAETATNKNVSHNLRFIANEESGHANLGSEIATWAIKADKTGLVQQQVAALRQTDLGQHKETYSDPKAGFIDFKQTQLLSEQVRDGLDVEIKKILLS
ncbi:MAG: hypothetical protein HRU38_13605 [Saccharospirillaceae bacterium]|nr:hypothetical protein [Pseudomonadales bacterium]NRB79680.1 hypothetical protein [Saccharospirillaceae bacterium]